MYLFSQYAGRGRNFWVCVNDGTVAVHAKGKHFRARIANGVVLEEATWTRKERITLRYGRDRTVKRGKKTIKEEYFEPGTPCAIRKGSLWKRERGISLCGAKGTVECYSTGSGAYGKEVFTYDNGRQAYTATRWRKKLVVNRPNGRLWLVINGPVYLGDYPIAERLQANADDLSLCAFVRIRDWDLTVYDANGSKVVTKGRIENRQKQGKWLERGKVTYYISGIEVSRELFEDDPTKWDGCEVLRIPNAQLRCSLLNRMGYDNLLAKVKSTTIDRSRDGTELVEIDTGVANYPLHRQPDEFMRLVKVICPSSRQVYVLRVPPDMSRCEQARQWTFGLREESIEEGIRFKLVKET
jgi:hypothetical protein